ncbi:histidine--tRNA ligase [Taibaiella sp. KBW10]|uniref:histidine--tRNA ligase n=1 Tax=Taibaiella sp. KBW10 TaxID=2153357 RepID=UPI000F593BFA|nr:histidine--tRNA ligase [Taibaiella sp. KBW10]RQO30316.1 histidine--tRNA ligase [Taibaiella sp. KBW10]
MKPSIPQGTRDFSPADVRRRQYILQTIKSVFEVYGYQPLETPSMENLSTLMGKYGEEGDRLIFKILNNGLHEKKDQAKLNEEWAKVLEKPYSATAITERALRYDLTIPFARYVVMHQNDLVFPFKRYQMQPVWRADRPQRGRYREFWQCDADVVGSNSLLNEAELLCIYQSAFHQLKVPGIQVKINSRKVLAGLAECCGALDKLTDITVAIDKLDKIGWDGVEKELIGRGLDADKIAYIQQYLSVTGNTEERLVIMETLLQASDIAQKGIAELRTTLHYFEQLKHPEWTSELIVDFTLARGLNYYTGIIVEVATTAVKMGSIGGGGRYDDLTGLFGLKGLSGVGVSFGIDRIYDVMEELALFPVQVDITTKILFVNIEPKAEATILTYLSQLRNAGISCELYSETAKFDKQMKYAHRRTIPFVGIVGESELAENKIMVKNMETGTQELVTITALSNLLS